MHPILLQLSKRPRSRSDGRCDASSR
jgi:hypothetical protein